jgi:hypothetical protein
VTEPPPRLPATGGTEMTAAMSEMAFSRLLEAALAGAKADGERPLKKGRPRTVRPLIG